MYPKVIYTGLRAFDKVSLRLHHQLGAPFLTKYRKRPLHDLCHMIYPISLKRFINRETKDYTHSKNEQREGATNGEDKITVPLNQYFKGTSYMKRKRKPANWGLSVFNSDQNVTFSRFNVTVNPQHVSKWSNSKHLHTKHTNKTTFITNIVEEWTQLNSE